MIDRGRLVLINSLLLLLLSLSRRRPNLKPPEIRSSAPVSFLQAGEDQQAVL